MNSNLLPRTALLLLILCHTVPAAARPVAAAPDAGGGGWTSTRLDLTVTVEPQAKRLVVEGSIRLRLDLEASFGPTLGVNFSEELMRFVEVRGPRGTKVTLGEGVPESPKMRTAAVRSGRAFSRGDEIDVSFRCESAGQGSQFVVAPDVALASWTAAWYPCALPTAEQGYTPALIRVAGRTTFVLPPGWSSISNGRLASRAASAKGTVDTWAVEQPIARSFAAGPYSVSTHAAGERSVAVYLLAQKPLGVDRQAELLAKALAAQEARFGPYPYPTYAIAEVPEKSVTWYASSEQGFIMARSSAFEAEHGNLPLWAHEMGHGWWGNLVTTTGPGSVWASESLAQYSAVLAIEAIEGPEAAAEFLEYSRPGYNPVQSAVGYFAMWRDGDDMPIASMKGENRWEHNLSDAKGHWVYHMLRRRVGDERFFATLRAIVRDYRGREVSVAAIREAFAKAAPDARTEEFFAQWLDRAGAPVIDLDWWSIDRGKGVSITVTQRGEPYTMPLEVAVDLKSGASKLFTLDVAKRRQTFELETGERPVAVRLDPNRRALVWRPEYGSAPGDP